MWIRLVPAHEDDEEEVREWAIPHHGDEDEHILEDCMAALQLPLPDCLVCMSSLNVGTVCPFFQQYLNLYEFIL